MRAVDSRNKVSFGGSLWNTTLEMEDFPELPLCQLKFLLRIGLFLTVFGPSEAVAVFL